MKKREKRNSGVIRVSAARRVAGASAMLALAVFLLAFIHKAGFGTGSVLWVAVWDFGHFPLFGLLALVTLWMIRSALGRRFGLVVQYTAALILVTGAGALSEYIQIATLRDADPVDWLRDIAGAISFLAVHLTVDPWLTESGRAMIRRRKPHIRLFAAAILLVSLVQVFIGAGAMIERRVKFPVLQSFDSGLERLFVDGAFAEVRYAPAPEEWEGNTSPAAEVTFRVHPWPTLHLDGPYPDWSGYDTLALEVFSPSTEPAVLNVSIRDGGDPPYGDRYDAQFELSPGYNRIRIPVEDIENAPEGRRLDLSSVCVILLFVLDPGEPLVLWFDNVVLE